MNPVNQGHCAVTEYRGQRTISELKASPGRPGLVSKGLILAILYVLYTRMVMDTPAKKRLSASKATDVIRWIVGWIAKNPSHFRLTQDDILNARIPCVSFIRRHFQFPAKFIFARIDEWSKRLAWHVEALLPIKPSCSHALWQIDGQFMTGKKLMRYLVGEGYSGKKIAGFCDESFSRIGSLYILRAVDVASSAQLGHCVLKHRANQLDVGRFLRAIILNWGCPLEIRVDLAGEHIAHGIYDILNERLDIGVQYKSSKSARLNASIESHHHNHSKLTASVYVEEKAPMVEIDGQTFVSVEAFATASDIAANRHTNRRMRESRSSPDELLDELPSVCRHHASAARIRSSFFFEWTRRVNGQKCSFSLGGREFHDRRLRYYSHVVIRYYPAFEGDRFEVRSKSGERLAKWTIN